MKTIAAICMMVMCFGAGPTTKPATRESNIPKIMAELRSEILQLKAQVDFLAKENSELRQQLAGLAKPSTQPALDAEIVAAIKDRTLVAGMTIEEARESMGSEGDVISESDYGKRYKWMVYRRGVFVADVKDGKIARWGVIRPDQSTGGTFNPNAVPGLGGRR